MLGCSELLTKILPLEQVEQSESVQAERALEAPRHLVWLLMRDPSQLDEQEQHMLTFLRQDPVVEGIYELTQSCLKMFTSGDCHTYLALAQQY